MSKTNETDPFEEIDTAVDGLFKRIFHGPNSLFSRARRAASGPQRPEIRITLKQEHIDRLTEGEELTLRAGSDQMIRLVAPAKYDREYVESMLRNRFISQIEAEMMLRQRA